MKLATLRDGTRDGRLVVVSTDLKRYTPAGRIAGTMQSALDRWEQCLPGLEALSLEVDLGQVKGEAFDPAACMAPLPRAYQFLDGSAYLSHVELVRRIRGQEVPDLVRRSPLMYQGGSDCFLGPRQPVAVADPAFGVDFEAEIVVVTDDVPMGTPAELAGNHIKLVMLMNDVSLRNLAGEEVAKGFGFINAKPPSSFSPVAVTPSELGSAWDGGRVALPLVSSVNGKVFGRPDAGQDMEFAFPRLISHAVRTRPLGAGTLIGSGTISNRHEGGFATAVDDGGPGYSCIIERRMVETLELGEASTSFLDFGDVVRIEMLDAKGRSVFGAIEQEIVPYALA